MTRRQIIRYVAIALIGVLLAITFVQLGRWQLDRLDERRDRNDTVVAHESEPVRPYQDLMDHEIADEDQWYRVSATGEYLPEQFQVRYRTLNGAYGSEVLAVLKTDQGENLVVNRGFIPRQGAAPSAELPPLLPGTVTITGFVQRNHRGDENAMTPHEGSLRLINSDVLSKAIGVELVNGYVSLLESTPAEATELTPLGRPSLDEGSHFSYALQWFAFTVIGVIGLVVLIRGDIRDRKKARKRALVEPANSTPKSTLVEPASSTSSVETPQTDPPSPTQ